MRNDGNMRITEQGRMPARAWRRDGIVAGFAFGGNAAADCARFARAWGGGSNEFRRKQAENDRFFTLVTVLPG